MQHLRRRDELEALLPDSILFADWMEVQYAREALVERIMAEMGFSPVLGYTDRYRQGGTPTEILFRRNFLSVGISKDGRWPEKFRTYNLELDKTYGIWLADILTEAGFEFTMKELIRLKRFYRYNFDLAPEFILDGIGPMLYDEYTDWLMYYSQGEHDDMMLAWAVRLGFKPNFK